MTSNPSDHPDGRASPHPPVPDPRSSGKEEGKDLFSILQSYFPFLRLAEDHGHKHRRRKSSGDDLSGSSHERRKKRRRNRGIHHRHPELFAGTSRERVAMPSASISRRSLKRRRMMEKLQHTDQDERDTLQGSVLDREQERMMREEAPQEVSPVQVSEQESAEISPLSVEVPETEEATSLETMETDTEEQAFASADASAVPDRFTLAKFFSFFLPFLSRKLRRAEEKTEQLSAELAQSKKATEHLTEELAKTEQQTEALLKQVPVSGSPADTDSANLGTLPPVTSDQGMSPPVSTDIVNSPIAAEKKEESSVAAPEQIVVPEATAVTPVASAPSVQSSEGLPASRGGFFRSFRGFFRKIFARKTPASPGEVSPSDTAVPQETSVVAAPLPVESVPSPSQTAPSASVAPASDRGFFGSLTGLFGGMFGSKIPATPQDDTAPISVPSPSVEAAVTPAAPAASVQMVPPEAATVPSSGFFASMRGFFGKIFAKKGAPPPTENVTPSVPLSSPAASGDASVLPVTAGSAAKDAASRSTAAAPTGQEEKKEGTGALNSLISSLNGGTPSAQATPSTAAPDAAAATLKKPAPPPPPPPAIFKPRVQHAYEKGMLAEIIGAIKYFGMGKEQMTIIQNLAMMLGAGLPLIDSLKTLQAELHSKAAKRLMKHITDAVDNGSALWRAMEDQHFFSPHAIALIRIGEEAGNLAENMEHLATQQEKDQELRGKVKMAMIYPTIVLVLIFVIVIGLGMFVLPNLVQVLFSLNVKLPLVTRIIIKFTNAFTEHGQTFVPAFMVGMCFLAALAKYTPLKVPVQWLLFKIPGIGRLAKEATIARFGVILGGLLQAGVPLVDALRSLAEVTPIVAYRKFYTRMLDHINVGDSFAKSFAAIRGSGKLLPLSVQQLIITGERTGSLAKIMLKISEIYDKKANETAQKLPVILEPMLLLIIGLIVGTIAFAIIVPIYSIVGNVGNT